jgi:hypothetical protein
VPQLQPSAPAPLTSSKHGEPDCHGRFTAAAAAAAAASPAAIGEPPLLLLLLLGSLLGSAVELAGSVADSPSPAACVLPLVVSTMLMVALPAEAEPSVPPPVVPIVSVFAAGPALVSATALEPLSPLPAA